MLTGYFSNAFREFHVTSMSNLFIDSSKADFGIILPPLSLLVTIAFAYSVLSPLINLLALISWCLFVLLVNVLLFTLDHRFRHVLSCLEIL